MLYRIRLERNAEKDLDKLNAPARRRLMRRIHALAEDPRPRGCRKLVGATDLWRIRVGDYRVIYSIDDESRQVRIDYVRHRKEVYR